MILRIFIFVAVLVVFIGVLLLLSQGSMIYMPREYEAAELKSFEREGLQRIEFETSEGAQAAHFYPPKPGMALGRVWLVFSGNGGRAVDYRDVVGADTADGYYFIDYPGYGLCEGRPNPKRIDESVEAAVAALGVEHGLSAKDLKGRLSACGHSLGAAVALRAAVRYEMEDVVLVAPFTTMKKMAAKVVGGLFSNVLLHRFDNVSAMEELQKQGQAKVRIINGTADREVPKAMGEELAKQFDSFSSYEAIEGAGHNDIFLNHLDVVFRAMRNQ